MKILVMVRERLGITQKFMAGLLGVSLPLYKAAEIGARKLPRAANRRLDQIYDFLSQLDEEQVMPNQNEMDLAWKLRLIRTLDAELQTIEYHLENWLEKYRDAYIQTRAISWLLEQPNILELELEYKAADLVKRHAEYVLGPYNQIRYWKLILKREAVKAQLNVLRGTAENEGGNGLPDQAQ